MVLREHVQRLLLLIVDVEPAGRLGQEEGEQDDEPGEEALEPGDEAPRVIAAGVEGAAGRARRDDGAAEPEGVVHGAHDAAEGRVVDLDDVHGARGRRDRDAEAEQEAAAHEGVGVGGHALDDGTDDDEAGADHHADAAAECVDGGTDCHRILLVTISVKVECQPEPPDVTMSCSSPNRVLTKWQSNDTTDLVHGRDDASPDTGILGVVVLQKGRVDQQVVDK